MYRTDVDIEVQNKKLIFKTKNQQDKMLTIDNIGALGTHEHAHVNLIEMKGHYYIFHITNKTKTQTKKLILNRLVNNYGKYIMTVTDNYEQYQLPIEDIKDIDKFVNLIRYINNCVWPYN